MKSIILSAINVLVFFISIYCSYGQVMSDFDKTADFTKYKTYEFKGWEKNSNEMLNEFDKTRITDAFKSELVSRGLIHDENNPDVAITLFVVIAERTSTTAYTNYNGGFGYGRSWGWGAGMGSATTTYSERDYKMGTIVIDFYDEETKKLVFQGTLQTEVNEKAKKREKSIPKNVAKLMKKYPVKTVK